MGSRYIQLHVHSRKQSPVFAAVAAALKRSPFAPYPLICLPDPDLISHRCFGARGCRVTVKLQSAPTLSALAFGVSEAEGESVSAAPAEGPGLIRFGGALYRRDGKERKGKARGPSEGGVDDKGLSAKSVV